MGRPQHHVLRPLLPQLCHSSRVTLGKSAAGAVAGTAAAALACSGGGDAFPATTSCCWLLQNTPPLLPIWLPPAGRQLHHCVGAICAPAEDQITQAQQPNGGIFADSPTTSWEADELARIQVGEADLACMTGSGDGCLILAEAVPSALSLLLSLTSLPPLLSIPFSPGQAGQGSCCVRHCF